MGSKIDTPTARKLLKPRHDPYFQRLEQGAYIGYRKLDANTGTWVARWRDEHGKQHHHTLGTFETFDHACKVAKEWLAAAKGGVIEDITVEEACKRYVANRRAEKGDDNADDAEGRFRRTVSGHPIGKLKLSALRTLHITEWRNKLAEVDEDDEDLADDPDAIRRAKDTANRYLATFKAALNFAYKMGLVSSTEQWDRVESYRGVGKRRDRLLSIAERKKLLLASPPDLSAFLKALLLTGARPGEMATAKVRDLDKTGLLTLDGKTGKRTVAISIDALKHLTECAGERSEDHPLLIRDDGQAWTRYYWRDKFQAARAAAEMEDVVVYALRHAAITEFIVSGIDPMSVAKITGTSIDMICKHYGHLMKEKITAQLSKVQML